MMCISGQFYESQVFLCGQQTDNPSIQEYARKSSKYFSSETVVIMNLVLRPRRFRQSCRHTLILLFFLLAGCAGMTFQEQQAKRAELDEMGEKTVLKLLELSPEAGEALAQSVGYTVVDMSITKIPVLGGGGGLAVTVDKRSGKNAYSKVSQFEIGGGIGAKKFKVIIFFSDEKLLDQVIEGAWHYEAGAEIAAGTSGAEGQVSKPEKGYQAFKIAEGGAAATITVRLAHATPYLQPSDN
jgi:hypothetical protein